MPEARLALVAGVLQGRHPLRRGGERCPTPAMLSVFERELLLSEEAEGNFKLPHFGEMKYF